MDRPLKIVISAYACEPKVGSEPEVGWQWMGQWARHHECWVFTRENNRAAILASGITTRWPGLHFEFYDLPHALRRWKKGIRGVHLYYLLWQWGAFFRARALHRRLGFDLCHHVTFSAMYHFPVFCLLPVPFVWGPVGGGEKFPWRFTTHFQVRHRLREMARIVLRLATRINPLTLLAGFRASLILAATRETQASFPSFFQHKVILEAQVGMDLQPSSNAHNHPGGPLRFITAGRHVYWKGIDLVLRAFKAYLDHDGPRATLTLLGSGPETERLKGLCHDLNIEDHVHFTSRLPTREGVLEAFAQADLFVYGSLLECAGYVVLEAMSVGTPVVCLDRPGPGELVDDHSGIRVRARDPQEAITGLALAMRRLATDPQRLAALSKGAWERVEREFAWNVKGKRLQQWVARFQRSKGDTP